MSSEIADTLKPTVSVEMSDTLKPTVSVEMSDPLKPTVSVQMSDPLENYFAQYSAGAKNKFTYLSEVYCFCLA